MALETSAIARISEWQEQWNSLGSQGEWAHKGIVAGCSLATSLVKVHYHRALKRFMAKYGHVCKLDVYIDDYGLLTLEEKAKGRAKREAEEPMQADAR